MKLTMSGTPEIMEYIDEIVGEMVAAFGITRDEAIGRVNRQWGGSTFDEKSLILHQMPDDWAGDIYYGRDSYWWRVEEADRRPLPYP